MQTLETQAAGPPRREALRITEGTGRPAASRALYLFRQFFLNREDVVAVLAPWKQAAPATPKELDAVLLSHLTGEEALVTIKTKRGTQEHKRPWRVGTYTPNPLDHSTRWACLDLDGKGHAAALLDPLGVALAAFQAALALGIRCELESSGGGSGWHLWAFFEAPIPAADARHLMLAIAPKDAPLVRGGVAKPTANEGLEVFPKQAAITGKGYGNLVWLPWWRRAPTGANLFYRPTEGAERAKPYTPEGFTPNTLESTRKALEALPSPRQGESRGNRSSPAKAPRKAPRAQKKGDSVWKSWRRDALATLPLEAVYGPWLTGRKRGSGWLEARDPGSPSGDRKPSAGVADGTGDAERAAFHSFRTDETLSVFDFLVRYGGEPDIMAAFRHVAELSGVPLPELLLRKAKVPQEKSAAERTALLPERYLRQLVAAERREQEEGKALDIASAKPKLRAAVLASFQTEGITVLRVTLGGGKTEQTIEAIARLSLTPGARIAFHVSTHDLAREVLQRLRAPKYREMGVRVRREFSGPSEEGLLDKNGARVCQIPAWQTKTEYGAGWFAPEICAQCPHQKRGCEAALGFEGDEDAAILISTHHKPFTEDVTEFIVDEHTELTRPDKITLEDLKSLLGKGQGCSTIAPRQREILALVARELFSYARAEGNSPSPIELHREALLRACEQKNGQPRAVVKRVPLGDLTDKEREFYSGEDGPAWAAARWIFACAIGGEAITTCTVKREGRKLPGLVCFRTTPMGKALAERQRALLLDATATFDTTRELTAVTGRPSHLVTIKVADGLPVDREWEATTATGRAELLDTHGRPNWSAIKPVIRRLVAKLEQRPTTRRVLLGTYRAIAVPLDWVLGGEGSLAPLDLRWQNLFPTAEMREQSLREAQEALLPLLTLCQARGGELAVLWFGKCRGVDAYKKFDSAIALGAPYGELGELQVERRAFCAPEEEDWEAFEGAAATELAQFFGRERPTLPHGRSRIFMLCLGPVLPLGWPANKTRLTYHPAAEGRPPREAPKGEEVATELRAAMLAAGNQSALARALGIGRSTLQNYLVGRVPPPEIREKIRAYMGQAGSSGDRCHERPIKISEGSTGYRASVAPHTKTRYGAGGSAHERPIKISEEILAIGLSCALSSSYQKRTGERDLVWELSGTLPAHTKSRTLLASPVLPGGQVPLPRVTLGGSDSE